MANEQQILESILVADCGTVFTKLLLLEKVEDSYRFVAQAETLTTINPPWSDVSVGVVHGIEELEQISGRRLMSGGALIVPQQGAEGVDAFVVILTAPEPLRLVLAGLVKEVSLESARRAAAGTYTHVEAVLSREGTLEAPENQWVKIVRDLVPDVVFVVGGVDGGASRPVIEMVETIAVACAMIPDKTAFPVILYAGNNQLHSELARLQKNIKTLMIVDNVHPTGDTEHLGPAQEALEKLYVEKRLAQTPGVETLMAWSRLSLLPASVSFGRVIEYLWHRRAKEQELQKNPEPEAGTLGVDVGAASITIAAAFEKQLYLSVHSHNGAAYGPLELVKEKGIEAILRWIPEEADPNEVMSFLYNRELRSWTVPQDTRELWIEQAVIREMLRTAIRVAQPTWSPGKAHVMPGMMPRLNPIVLTGGGVVNLPKHALLTVLDGLEPVGISNIYLDVNRTATALGAIAGVNSLAAAAALDAGALVPLGTVISPIGQATSGEIILKMNINDGSSEYAVEVKAGGLEVIFMEPGKTATVELKPSRKFDVGMGGPGKGGKIQVIGGLVGLVVDGRGRPLRLSNDPDVRRENLRRWFWDVGVGV